MREDCVDHLNFTGQDCPSCNLEVDEYGNTEEQFTYCSFPHCGCDGARLCDAKEGASSLAIEVNVEGMWQSKSYKARVARMKLVGIIAEERSNDDK